MLTADDIEEVLIDAGLIDRRHAYERSNEYEIALDRITESVDTLFADRMARSLWFNGELTTQQIEEVEDGRLLEDVDAYDLYRLLREDWSELDQGPWQQLSIDLTRRWNDATNQIAGEAEARIREEVAGSELDTVWDPARHFFTESSLGHIAVPPLLRGPEDELPEPTNQRPTRLPMIGTDVEVRVGSVFVPARVIGTPATRRGTLYELQRTDTGRKLRKLRTIEELHGWR